MRRKNRRVSIDRAVLETLEGRQLLSLAAPVGYNVGSPPQSLATGDFNGDGRADVVTANANSTVSVRLSNANGTLQAPQSFATGLGPQSVAVGDVNNDGKLDVVTANSGGNLSVLIGNGNGTLQPASSVVLPPQIPVGTGYTGTDPLPQVPGSVVVGDMNADGKLDLVASGRTTFTYIYYGYWGPYYRQRTDEHVNVLLGNGGGAFPTVNTYQQIYVSPSLGVADFNNDSKLDVVTAPYAAHVRLGNGNGTLQPILQSGGFGYSVETVIGDFDNDGKRDLVVRGGPGLQVLKGQGNGTFAVAGGVSNTDNLRAVVTGDVNADGKLDLVLTSQRTTYGYYGYYQNYDPTTTHTRKVMLGFGDNTFSLPITTTLRVEPEYPTYGGAALAMADLNADGRQDVIATDYVDNLLEVQLNEGDWVAPVAMQVSDVTVTEGHAGSVNAVFTVSIDHAAAFNIFIDYATSDGTATAGDDFVTKSGTLTIAAGQTSGTVTVQVSGDRIGEGDEQFYLNLTNPVNAFPIDDTGVGTILDDEPRVSITNFPVVTEGNSGTTPMNFTATLSAASDQPVTVAYHTGPYGTATAGADYDSVSGTLTFTPGQTSRTIAVPIRGDTMAEESESVYVTLENATNALIANNLGQGTITDNDPGPAVSIGDATRAEGNSGLTAFEFTLTLAAPSGRWAYVNYATGGGSASTNGGNRDYETATGSVAFAPGQTRQTIVVNVRGDTRSESDETFFVNLTNPNDVTIGDGQGLGTILNDETRGKTWVGPATGGNWSTAANWSPSGVPTTTSLVTVSGASVTVPSSVTVSELSLNNGATLTVAANGNRVFRAERLFIDYPSTLDLKDNDLIVDYTGASVALDFENHVRSGFNYVGDWLGTGITSSIAALDGNYVLAVADNAKLTSPFGTAQGGQLFAGQNVDLTTVLVKFTHRADLNLDGRVNADDSAAFGGNYDAGQPAVWATGDLNFDGLFTPDDSAIFGGSYDETVALL